MPIEFDEYKIGEQKFSPTGRPMGKVVAKPKENTNPYLVINRLQSCATH